MLALTMLLSAAAGVNAIFGANVDAIQLSETEFICSEGCVHEGVFFAQEGYFCPEKEVIRQIEANGNDQKWLSFDCAGAKLPKGLVARPLRDGEEAEECGVNTIRASGPGRMACNSARNPGSGTKTLQWSEVEEMVKSATANTTEKNKPVPPKSRQECSKMGQQKFAECREKNDDFEACNKQGGEAIKNCLDGK